MDKKLLDNVRGNVKMFMQSGKDAMKGMQEHPIGKQPRSKREIGIMMKKMQELPPAERQSRMVEMANLAGHKGDQLDNCDICQYIKEAMLKKK